MNSIIITTRNRDNHLKRILQCLEACFREVDAKNHEVIVIDTSIRKSDPQASFPLTVIQGEPRPIFNKCKSINAGVIAAKGRLITILDVDCLPAPLFLKNIETFFASAQPHAKLAHTVRMMDVTTSEKVMCNCHKSGEDFVTWFDLAKSKDFNKYGEEIEGNKTGGSRFTMLKDDFLELGGMDERFEGYGFEDHEFNMRYFTKYGPSQFIENNDLYHLFHYPTTGWGLDADESRKANGDRYTFSKLCNFAPLVKGESWGIIPLADSSDDADDAARPLLSILIATQPCRKEYLDRLLAILNPQITEEVELIIDAEPGSTGAKRQRMVEKSKGVYVVNIDDDDLIVENYCDQIIEAIVTDMPDVVTFLQARKLNGRFIGNCKFGLDERWQDVQKGLIKYTRPPCHVTPIRRTIAIQVGFDDKTVGEDYEFSKVVGPLCETEVHINDVLYTYLRRTDKKGC